MSIEATETASAKPGVGPTFADGKDADAFRTIGEVAQALSIRPHVLRYWEDQFPMLRPVKRSGGRRYYRPEDVRLIEVIDRLVHREGYTLRGARQWLEGQARGRGKGKVPAPAVAAPVAPPVPEIVAAPATEALAAVSVAAMAARPEVHDIGPLFASTRPVGRDLLPQLHALRATLVQALENS